MGCNRIRLHLHESLFFVSSWDSQRRILSVSRTMTDGIQNKKKKFLRFKLWFMPQMKSASETRKTVQQFLFLVFI